MASGGPAIPKGAAQFFQNLGAVVACIVALASVYGSISGYIANSKADANNNKLRNQQGQLAALQQQFDQSERFAADIRQNSHDIARNSAPVEAMVGYVSLYAAAQTVDRKLIIVEMAQASNDSLSLNVLCQLLQNDDAIQHPSESDANKAQTIRDTLQSAIQSKYNSFAARSVPADFHDVRVTTVSRGNPVAAANGEVLAALTAVKDEGWVFIGDVESNDRGKTRPLIGNYVQESQVPAKGATITARTSLNLRAIPFTGGQLGEVVGVVPEGTRFQADQDAKRYPYRHNFGRGATAQWQAIWVHGKLTKK